MLDSLITHAFLALALVLVRTEYVTYDTSIVYKVLQCDILVMIDRKTDRNCETGGFELIYKQPAIASPPYIGLNLSLEGHAYTRAGVRMSSTNSYQPPNAYAMATARSPSPASATQQSQAVSTSSMSSLQVGIAGKQTERREKGERLEPAKRGYVDLPPARIATVTANAAADEGTSALPLNFLPVLRYRNARGGGLPNAIVSGPKKALPPVGGAGDTRTTLRQSLTVRKLALSEEEGGSSSGTRHAQEPLPHFVQLHKFQSLLRSKRVRSVLGNSYPAGAKESFRILSTSTTDESALWNRPEPPRRSSSVLEVQVSRLDPRLRVEHRPSSSVERLLALDERPSAYALSPQPQPHRPSSASVSAAASRSSSAAANRPLSAVALPEPVPMGLLRASRSHQSSASRANVSLPDSL